MKKPPKTPRLPCRRKRAAKQKATGRHVIPSTPRHGTNPKTTEQATPPRPTTRNNETGDETGTGGKRHRIAHGQATAGRETNRKQMKRDKAAPDGSENGEKRTETNEVS